MEDFLNITGNFFFPLCLSIFLIVRIDKFLSQFIKDMKKISKTQTKILYYLKKNGKFAK